MACHQSETSERYFLVGFVLHLSRENLFSHYTHVGTGRKRAYQHFHGFVKCGVFMALLYRTTYSMMISKLRQNKPIVFFNEKKDRIFDLLKLINKKDAKIESISPNMLSNEQCPILQNLTPYFMRIH